jgi:GTP-binding protein HflX
MVTEHVFLADTAGANVVGRALQLRHAPDPKYYIGSGKAGQIKSAVQARGAAVVVFNDDLSPSQIRNLEKLFSVRIIDRSMLILDIFAKHARTYESKIQVELARMHYMAPRLTGMWTHFSQQAGGIGAARRGPGERQLEEDKRIVRKRIADLKKKLSRIEGQRGQQKKGRENIVRACVAGYTNAGKSTLLNALSRAGVKAEDKLFATLDATTRRVFVPDFGPILLSDTVGFLRRLPHHLVASFKSTLEVITDANLILCIVDAASSYLREQMETANAVLNDLDTARIPRLLVFNKVDTAVNHFPLDRLKAEFPDALFISALTGQGVPELKQALGGLCRKIAPSAAYCQKGNHAEQSN